jgi:hypothetical protein
MNLAGNLVDVEATRAAKAAERGSLAKRPMWHRGQQPSHRPATPTPPVLTATATA